MVRRLPSCAQPSPFFLPGLREEILFLIAICPIYFSFHGKVGSGFCPILPQRERRDGARRAPPIWRWTSTRYACPRRKRRESRKNSDIAVCGKISTYLLLGIKRYFADSLLFDSCFTVFEPCDSVTADSGGIHFFALSSFILALAVALRSSVYGAEMR